MRGMGGAMPQHLQHAEARIRALDVGRHLQADRRDRVQVSQWHRDHVQLLCCTRVTCGERALPLCNSLLGPRCAREQNVHHVLVYLTHAPAALLLCFPAKLPAPAIADPSKIDDDAPTPIESRKRRLGLGCGATGGRARFTHLRETTSLQERQSVDGLIDNEPQLIPQLELRNGRL